MKEFIEAFKNTSYYENIFKFNPTEIVFIYVSGSMLIDVTDDRSDYDIVVYTIGGEFIDASQYEYLMYRGRKVHWYFRPINKIFDIDNSPVSSCIGNLFISNLCDDFIIYENPKYKELIDKIHSVKNQLSHISAYCFFNIQRDLIERILTEGKILEDHYTKYLYHLCVGSYYLTNEPLDKDFLVSLKRIRWTPVSDEYKQLAVNRLRIYKNYLEQNPIDLEDQLKKLYDQLELEQYEIRCDD